MNIITYIKNAWKNRDAGKNIPDIKKFDVNNLVKTIDNYYTSRLTAVDLLKTQLIKSGFIIKKYTTDDDNYIRFITTLPESKYIHFKTFEFQIYLKIGNVVEMFVYDDYYKKWKELKVVGSNVIYHDGKIVNVTYNGLLKLIEDYIGAKNLYNT